MLSSTARVLGAARQPNNVVLITSMARWTLTNAFGNLLLQSLGPDIADLQHYPSLISLNLDTTPNVVRWSVYRSYPNRRIFGNVRKSD
jgi:hypothetical protein